MPFALGDISSSLPLLKMALEKCSGLPVCATARRACTLSLVMALNCSATNRRAQHSVWYDPAVHLLLLLTRQFLAIANRWQVRNVKQPLTAVVGRRLVWVDKVYSDFGLQLFRFPGFMFRYRETYGCNPRWSGHLNQQFALARFARETRNAKKFYWPLSRQSPHRILEFHCLVRGNRDDMTI